MKKLLSILLAALMVFAMVACGNGTAKGGIVLAIKHEMNIPVRYIGVGEQMDDLQEFNSKDFAKALFDEE